MSVDGDLVILVLFVLSLVAAFALLLVVLVRIRRRGREPGHLFALGQFAYQGGDYPAALAHFRPAARSGHAGAQLALGNMYLFGRGVARDLAEAERLITLAANQGLAAAQYRLAEMHRRGTAARPSAEEAERWMRAAADQGYAPAAAQMRAVGSDLPTERLDRPPFEEGPRRGEAFELPTQRLAGFLPTQRLDAGEARVPGEAWDPLEPTQTMPAFEPTETWDAGEPTKTWDPGEPTQAGPTFEPMETLETLEPTQTLPGYYDPEAHPQGREAYWCPDCAARMEVYHDQPATTDGRLFRCPVCDYSCGIGDHRIGIPPHDQVLRCRKCGAVNEWDRAGDVFLGPPPTLRCRRCGHDNQDVPPSVR
jgi:hypothetical protein